jgi:tetratricopeptide (TPR) repeat protein
LRILPDSPDTLASYSALDLQRGNYQSAGAMMEKALSMSGRNNINYDSMMVTFAVIMMKTNHPDWALANLNRETRESPLYAPAWLTRAELHLQQGEFAAAREDARMGLRLAPGDPHAQDVLRRVEASGPSESQR